MKKTISILVALAALILVAVFGFLYLRRQPVGDKVADEIEANKTPVTTTLSEDIDTAEQTPTVATQPKPVEDTREQVAATRRMYMAHAPLRTPEVADPDSAANRQILETMVAKALKRSQPSELTSQEGK